MACCGPPRVLVLMTLAGNDDAGRTARGLHLLTTARHNGYMTSFGDLLGPQPVLLPSDIDAEAELEAGEKPAIVAAAHPSASVA